MHTPETAELPRIEVTAEQVEQRLRTCEKPRGLLPGDIFPDLLTQYAGRLSEVVACVLNAAYKQETWPDIWKIESVSIIPESSNMENLNNVRNISCTPVLGKVMEYFVLERLKEEIGPRNNQYGGGALPGAELPIICCRPGTKYLRQWTMKEQPYRLFQ